MIQMELLVTCALLFVAALLALVREVVIWRLDAEIKKLDIETAKLYLKASESSAIAQQIALEHCRGDK